MSTVQSCARPYAGAAFQAAKADQLLPQWNALLQSMAYMMNHPRVVECFNHPHFTDHQLESLLCSVAEFFPEIQEKAKRFISTLKENHRFVLVPEISKQFERKWHEFNNTHLIHVTTAAPVSPEWLGQLEAALAKKLNCQVTFECEVDESILAGAIIKMDDRVMDASVRNKLNRLLEFSLR